MAALPEASLRNNCNRCRNPMALLRNRVPQCADLKLVDPGPVDRSRRVAPPSQLLGEGKCHRAGHDPPSRRRRSFSGLESCTNRGRSLHPGVLVRPRWVRVEQSRSIPADSTSNRVGTACAALQGRREAAPRARGSLLWRLAGASRWHPPTRRMSLVWCWSRPAPTIRDASCWMASLGALHPHRTTNRP